MPENTATPGETPNTQTGETPAVSQPTIDELKAELDAIRKALKTANSEAADRRKKLDAFEQAEEQRKQAEMTEAQKAIDAKTKAEEAAKRVMQAADAKLKRAAFMAEASKFGVTRPEDAYALALADGVEITVSEDGEVSGVVEAVKALVEAGRLPLTGGRPGAPSLDGGAGGKQQPQKYAPLTPLESKVARAAGMTDEQYAQYKQSMPTQQAIPGGQDTGSTLAELLGGNK